MTREDRIVDFYGGAADDRGRHLEQIWSWPDDEIETVHDFIQWLFPLDTVSRANPNAPLVTASTIQAFQQSDELRGKLEASLERMLAFYGLRHAGDRIEKSDTFPKQRRYWLGGYGWLGPNHNHLRITRILRSLALLGLPHHTQALAQCLADLYPFERSHINKTTLRYWMEAAADLPSG
jgi:Opioid growth factor receptor (OGFr) conserved region